VCFSLGVTLGFGSPRSLSDTTVRNCKGDMKELKPSIMAGVPAVWETIRKGVLAKVNQASPFKQWMFRTALSFKITLMEYGMPSGFLDFVFKGIKENTGGRLRLAVSGMLSSKVYKTRWCSYPKGNACILVSNNVSNHAGIRYD